MAQLPSSFNSDEHEDMNDYSAIPAGDYHLIVEDTDYVQNSAQTGHYLKVIFKVMSGDHSGKKIFVNLNLDNPNATAVDIANKELATLCRACGLSTIDDSEELHGIELTGVVGIRPPKGDYPASNTIKNYKALEGAVAAPAKSAGASASKTPPPPRKKPVFEDD